VGGGFVVEADVDSIASGIEDLINDGNLVEMGLRLRKVILEKYTWEKICHSHITFFNHILTIK